MRWWFVLGVALAACAEPSSPPARWSYVYAAIVQPACTTSSCHSAATAIAGVNLAGREGAFTMLTGRICGAPESPLDPPGNFVVPYDVGGSRLFHMLVGDDAAQMPPDVPLPDLEIELVARWIEAGARCD